MGLAPDRFDDEPVLGWRWWRWELATKTLRPWFFWEDEAAWPRHASGVAKCLAAQVLRQHEHPTTECTCGFWAFRTEEQVHEYTDGKRIVLLGLVPVYGQVSLWGKVVEHEDGWRASKAYPYSVIVPEGEVYGSSMDGRPSQIDVDGIAALISGTYAVDARGGE